MATVENYQPKKKKKTLGREKSPSRAIPKTEEINNMKTGALEAVETKKPTRIFIKPGDVTRKNKYQEENRPEKKNDQNQYLIKTN